MNFPRHITSLSPEKLDLLSKQLQEKGLAVPAEKIVLRREHQNLCPLSFAQQRLWFLDRLEPGLTVYNVPVAVRLVGELNHSALWQALNEVVRRHEVLRTTFRMNGDQPAQFISPPQTLQPTHVDLRRLPGSIRQLLVSRLISFEAQRHFDLSEGPLIRLTVMRLNESEHALVFVLHHIICDGWSLGLLVTEISQLYFSFAHGLPSSLSELRVQYGDFAIWQRSQLTIPKIMRQLDYWSSHLKGAPYLLDLSSGRRRPSVQSHCGSKVKFLLPEKLTIELRRVANECRATLFMILMGCFDALLWRYSGQDDIVIGTPVAGRTRAEVEGLIGFFVNMLAMMVKVKAEESFLELMNRVREVCLNGYENQEAPFEIVVSRMGVDRDLSQQPLFQVMLNWVSLSGAGGGIRLEDGSTVKWTDGLAVSAMPVKREAAIFDLNLMLGEEGGVIRGEMEYSTDLFDEGAILRMLAHFSSLLESAATDSGRKVSELQLMTQAEHEQLLVELNRTQRGYTMDHGVCVHELFENQVNQAPDTVAVVFGEEHLSYSEFNDRANRLARYLRARGVDTEARVGILVERSVESFIGLLGTLKAGGAYVPLDPNYPPARLQFMLRDAGVKALLTKMRLAEHLNMDGMETICLDADWNEITRESSANFTSDVKPENLGYIIYTSGSTGLPKGVLGEHRATLNRLAWMWQEYPFEEGEICCQKTSLNFVDSVWEIFGPLLRGVKTVIIPAQSVSEPLEFIQKLALHYITRIVLVPSLLRVMIDSLHDIDSQLPNLKIWVTSGEEITEEISRRFLAVGRVKSLLNLYGSTEVAADALWYDAGGNAKIGSKLPIGRPIANTEVYILDRFLRPVPIGILGEIYVGGANLARGYHNRPELSAERFIAHHLSRKPGERLYRTGDLGRYLADGNIEYSGRFDRQVKIRGCRIELGEVEAELRATPSVHDAVVVADGDQLEGARLVAYVVSDHASEDNSAKLYQSLCEKLPPHMIPSVFIQIDSAPLTPNGKIDYRALPNPGTICQVSKKQLVAPRTPLEEVLASLWIEVLGTDQIGVFDNFFQIGGHSLLATQLLNQLREKVQIEVPLRAIFEKPTLAGWAESAAEACGGRDIAEEIALTVLELSSSPPNMNIDAA